MASRSRFSSGTMSPCCAGRTCQRAAAYESPVFAARTDAALEVLVACHPAFVHASATASPASLPETDGPGQRPEIRSHFASVTDRAGAGRRRLDAGHAGAHTRWVRQACQAAVPRRAPPGEGVSPSERKRDRPESGQPLLLSVFRRCPTLPRGLPRSTIGAEELNFRVRNGTGCFPFAMAAGNSMGLYRPIRFQAISPELHSGREPPITRGT